MYIGILSIENKWEMLDYCTMFQYIWVLLIANIAHVSKMRHYMF